MVDIKHNFCTMLLWEEITKKPFELSGVGDVLKYMYLCFRHSGGDEKVTLEEFCDSLTPGDVDNFRLQLQGETPDTDTEEKDDKKKAWAISLLIASFILAWMLISYLIN